MNRYKHRFLDKFRVFGVSLLTIAGVMSSATLLQAQEKKDSFTYLGGTLSKLEDNGIYDTDFGIGIEGIYMKKVWGGFAVGLRGGYTFAFPFKETSSNNVDGQTINMTLKRSNSMLTATIPLGGISDYSDNSRLVYFIGPTVWQSFSKSTVRVDVEMPENGYSNSSFDRGTTMWGISGGVYYQFPDAPWTVGLNGTAVFRTEQFDGFDAASQISLSVGYAF